MDIVTLPDPWTLGVPPRSALPQSYLDLSGSQSPLGCSPYAARRAIEAVGATQATWRHALGSLRAALSRKFSVAEERISLGAGCRVLLPALFRALCEVGDGVAVAMPCPPLYRVAAAQAGVRLVEVASKSDFSHDLDAWRAALRRERPRIALVGHPLNPSGRFMSRDDVNELLEAAGETLIVMDEAYADYADKPEFPRLAPMLDDAPTLVIARSFSSLNGLGGLPAAYALSTAENAARMQGHLLGLEPGEVAARAAVATVEEPSFDVLVTDRVGRSRFKLMQTLREWSVGVECGLGPWVMAQAADSADAARRLAARGLRVRDLGPWGCPGWLRIRAGSEDEVERFIKDAKVVLTKRPG